MTWDDLWCLCYRMVMVDLVTVFNIIAILLLSLYLANVAIYVDYLVRSRPRSCLGVK